MSKRFWWVGLGFGLLVSVAGCSEVENCETGSKGCFEGACDDKNPCKFDLVCMVLDASGDRVCGVKRDDDKYDCGEKGDCSRPANVGGGDGDGDACDCEDGELCVPGSATTCVNYCEVPDTIPGSKLAPGACRPKPTADDPNPPLFPYAQACEALCLQICYRDEVFCGVPCDPSACGGAAIRQVCEDEFGTPDAAGSVEAITATCEEVRDSACEDYMCFEGTLDCAGVVCNNDCGSGAYNFDGECDDGDFSNAGYAVCAWGSDCGDCGPRKGTPPPRRLPIGSLCLGDAQCAGYSDDITINQAWCLRVDGTNVDRCMPDCSGEGKTCPDGYECAPLSIDGQPYEIDGIRARACNPLVCK